MLSVFQNYPSLVLRNWELGVLVHIFNFNTQAEAGRSLTGQPELRSSEENLFKKTRRREGGGGKKRRRNKF